MIQLWEPPPPLNKSPLLTNLSPPTHLSPSWQAIRGDFNQIDGAEAEFSFPTSQDETCGLYESTSCKCQGTEKGPWLADNQSRDLNKGFWLDVYLVRSVADAWTCNAEIRDLSHAKDKQLWIVIIYPLCTRNSEFCIESLQINIWNTETNDNSFRLQLRWAKENIMILFLSTPNPEGAMISTYYYHAAHKQLSCSYSG